LGLVDRLHPGPSVYAAALEAASRYAQGPIVAIGAAKAGINAGSGQSPAAYGEAWRCSLNSSKVPMSTSASNGLRIYRFAPNS
jgi:hypothetical protein